MWVSYSEHGTCCSEKCIQSDYSHTWRWAWHLKPCVVRHLSTALSTSVTTNSLKLITCDPFWDFGRLRCADYWAYVQWMEEIMLCFKSLLFSHCYYKDGGERRSSPVHHKWKTMFSLWWRENWLEAFGGVNGFVSKNLAEMCVFRNAKASTNQTKHFCSFAIISLPSHSCSNIPFVIFEARVIPECLCLRSGLSTGFTVTDTLIKMRILLAWGNCDTCQMVDIF